MSRFRACTRVHIHVNRNTPIGRNPQVTLLISVQK